MRSSLVRQGQRRPPGGIVSVWRRRLELAVEDGEEGRNGDSDGVVELEEMLGDADGVTTLAGTSAAAGEDARVLTRVSIAREVAKDGIRADPLVDRLNARENGESDRRVANLGFTDLSFSG
ncbi:hypothetical protein K7X08_006428 [Anisodus acutangulus]|uniref:Uncharacterized protein n=1 Tax=Anisodus acutangulus TaxID=402998 RepID=A0A9Q1N1D8_9SOLA|nr:hypothetical protein K7X08_006428 [Anisodus acutangulus]